MKPEEAVGNYPSKLREYTNFSVREIKKICKEIGPRASGSESEHKAQEYLAEKLTPAADSVAIEDFKISQTAFMSWVIIAGVFLTASVACAIFGLFAVSLVLLFITLFCLVGEFVMYKQVLDPFFKKYTSCNVVAVRKPKGEVKRRVIVSGHVDSAFEWTFTHLGGAALLKSVMIYAILGLVYLIVVSVLGLIFPDACWVQTMSYIALAFVPAFIAVLFFTNYRRPVEGANDNLTGSLTAVSCMKFMADNDIRFENTELMVVTTGSEEAGLRGAKAFAKKHLDECKAVETLFIGFDTMRDFDDLAIYSRDLSGTVKHDQRACDLVKRATEAAGLPDIQFSSVYLGASDAAAITQAGITATCVAAMDPSPARYYHTREDTADILEPKTIEAGINIALNAIFAYDEKGLDA